MVVPQQWGRGLRAIGPWLPLEPLPPGATLLVLLLWRSQRFVHPPRKLVDRAGGCIATVFGTESNHFQSGANCMAVMPV